MPKTDKYLERYPGYNTSPVGDNLTVAQDGEGNIVIPDDLQDIDLLDGPTRSPREFGKVPEVSGSIVVGSISANPNREPLQIVELLHRDDTMTLDGVTPDGDVVPIDLESDPFIPTPRSIIELSEDQRQRYTEIKNGVERLSFARGALDFLCGERPRVDPQVTRDGNGVKDANIEKATIRRARLALHRLIADMNEFVLRAGSEHGLSGVIEEVNELRIRHVTPSDIDRLDRAFIGGKTALRPTSNELNSAFQKKVDERGLRERSTTDSISIKLVDGELIITEDKALEG